MLAMRQSRQHIQVPWAISAYEPWIPFAHQTVLVEHRLSGLNILPAVPQPLTPDRILCCPRLPPEAAMGCKLRLLAYEVIHIS
jgi:hypothetical protein